MGSIFGYLYYCYKTHYRNGSSTYRMASFAISTLVILEKMAFAPICRCWFLFKTRSTKWFNFRANKYSWAQRKAKQKIFCCLFICNFKIIMTPVSIEECSFISPSGRVVALSRGMSTTTLWDSRSLVWFSVPCQPTVTGSLSSGSGVSASPWEDCSAPSSLPSMFGLTLASLPQLQLASDTSKTECSIAFIY